MTKLLRYVNAHQFINIITWKYILRTLASVYQAFKFPERRIPMYSVKANLRQVLSHQTSQNIDEVGGRFCQQNRYDMITHFTHINLSWKGKVNSEPCTCVIVAPHSGRHIRYNLPKERTPSTDLQNSEPYLLWSLVYCITNVEYNWMQWAICLFLCCRIIKRTFLTMRQLKLRYMVKPDWMSLLTHSIV